MEIVSVLRKDVYGKWDLPQESAEMNPELVGNLVIFIE